MFIKLMYWIVYIIALFFVFDGMLTSDKLETLFAGFLIFGIVVHGSLTESLIEGK